MKWTFSGFIDEISPDFTEQCRVAAGLGLRFIVQQLIRTLGGLPAAP